MLSKFQIGFARKLFVLVANWAKDATMSLQTDNGGNLLLVMTWVDLLGYIPSKQKISMIILLNFRN